MKIVICTKQVPSVEDVGFNAESRTIIREGVPNEINPFDRRALGIAVELKSEFGAEVVAVTMGPPQAAEVLRECLAVAADRAIHVSDRALAGSDTLVTARVLAAVVRREAPDIVFCGKYSVDAETGQVGPELAELLGLPVVTGATSLKLDADGRQAVVGRETDEGIDTVEVDLPVVLTAAERLIRPPKVAPEALEAAQARPIETLSAGDLGFTAEQVGSAGSPTWVADIMIVKAERSPRLIHSDEDPRGASRELVQHLLERGLFGTWQPGSAREPLPIATPASSPDRAVWVVAEIADGEPRPVTYELLGGAVDVARAVGGQVGVLLVGDAVTRHVPRLAAHGASLAYVAEAPEFAVVSPEIMAHVLARAIQAHHPWAVLAPASSDGREYAPLVAARLGLGLTGDAIGLEVGSDGALRQMKPAFGGAVVAPILSRTFPRFATVRPGALQEYQPDASRSASIVQLPVDGTPTPRVRLLQREVQAGEEGTRLDYADVVVCAGAGLGGPENLSYVEELAEVLDGAVGATRRVVDAGWLPRQYQIGLTGKVLQPRLYVGVAVRGAFNHTIGIRRAGTVVAINNDPQAALVAEADYALIGDWRTVVPALTEVLREVRSQEPLGAASGAS